jgi:hypothetical protein
MADWDSFRRFVKERYTVASDDLDSLSLVFDAGSNRTQVITMMKSDWFDHDWLTIWTTVCTEAELAPRDALLANVGLPGALALIDDGTAIFKYSLALDDVDPSEVESAFHLVVEYGDLLESQQTGGGDEH